MTYNKYYDRNKSKFLMDPQVPRCRKSRTVFKHIRNRQNRGAQKEAQRAINNLADINNILTSSSRLSSNFHPFFSSFSSSHIFSLISEKKNFIFNISPILGKILSILLFLHLSCHFPQRRSQSPKFIVTPHS